MEFKKILIPVSKPEFTEEVVRVACNLAKLYKSKIYALYVIELPLTLPLDSNVPDEMNSGEELLQKVKDIAEEDYDIEIETDILQARAAGPAIVEEAINLGVDLILVEAPLNEIGEDKLFGSNIDYILKHAECNVMIIKPKSIV